MNSSFRAPYSSRALSASPPAGCPRFHTRPSMNNTLRPASFEITQLPTIGAKLFGSRPGVSLAKLTRFVASAGALARACADNGNAPATSNQEPATSNGLLMTILQTHEVAKVLDGQSTTSSRSPQPA